MMKFVRHFWPLVVLSLCGCFTAAKEQQIQSDIFNLQQRLYELEKNQSTTVKSNTESTRKQMASTSTNLEKLQVEIQKIKGEVDAIRVGVQTGQIPGEEVREGSMLYTLNDILNRLETVESSQAEILDAIQSTSKDKSSEKKKTRLSTLSALQAAFDKKLYPRVVEDAPILLKKVKKSSSKEEIKFLHAESLYKLGKLRDAALKFNDFIESKPSDKRLPQAKLRMGDCFRHLGDKATSKVYYSEVIDQYPDTDQAKTARQRLEKL